jgi:uncharacterized protein (TIGR00304 family)
MISRTWVPVATFLGGIACIAASVATGEAEVDLVVIFPVFSGSSGLFLLGIGLIILSFLVGFAMLAMTQAELAANVVPPAMSQKPAVEKKTRYGGVVLIGPVPIAFGSDKRTAVIMLVLGIAMAIALISVLLMLG